MTTYKFIIYKNLTIINTIFFDYFVFILYFFVFLPFCTCLFWQYDLCIPKRLPQISTFRHPNPIGEKNQYPVCIIYESLIQIQFPVHHIPGQKIKNNAVNQAG